MRLKLTENFTHDQWRQKQGIKNVYGLKQIFQGVHSKIDRLIGGQFLKDKLKEVTKLHDYKLGKEKRGFFTTNLIDSMVESEIYKRNKFEDMFQMSIGGTFGKENKLQGKISGGKGWSEGGIGGTFGKENKVRANLSGGKGWANFNISKGF